MRRLTGWHPDARQNALRTAFAVQGGGENKKESKFCSQIFLVAKEWTRMSASARGDLGEWPSTHASWLAPTPTPTLKTRNEVKCFSPLRVVRVCAC